MMMLCRAASEPASDAAMRKRCEIRRDEAKIKMSARRWFDVSRARIGKMFERDDAVDAVI